MSSKMKIDNNVLNNSPGGLLSGLIKQCIAVFICIAFVLGMKFCDNPKISLWADSLGYALRQNTDWNTATDSVLSWLENILPALSDSPSENTTQTPDNNADAITFH